MALSNELTNKRSSGIIDTNRSTLNMRSNRAINIVEPAAGYKLPNTMMVSNMFHPLEKKCFNFRRLQSNRNENPCRFG